MAQFGRALRSGRRGRKFESCRFDTDGKPVYAYMKSMSGFFVFEGEMFMRIHGFQKLTLLDYPGKIGCTIFLGNCNFRCPFCHNAELVLSADKEPVMEEEEVLAVLQKRQGILEGVCITGGEPTLFPDLFELIGRIRELGYAVKLDTNGYRPEVLKKLVRAGMLDYVAMDIKNSPARYGETVGMQDFRLDKIRESVGFLMNGSLDYEFRTTVTRELHSKKELIEIGKWIQGCSRYYLQQYQESASVIRPVFSAYTPDEIHQLKELLAEYIEEVYVRGV